MDDLTGTSVAYWTVQGMARASGAPLSRAMADGRLTRKGLADLVGRCQTCPAAKACMSWLADPTHCTPPEFCAIGPDIARLAVPAGGPRTTRH
jgi:hypothetical protein